VAAVYQNNWLEPVLCNMDTNFKEVLRYNYSNNQEKYVDKEKFIEFLLLPPDKRNELDDKYVSMLIDGIYKLQIPSEAKIAFIRYTEATEKKEIQMLRSQVIYHIFNSETAFRLAKIKENNIELWYNSMRKILEPNISDLDETNQQKIIALLVQEQAKIDGSVESQSLFNRFVDYI
jgi:hypothetical protein